MIQNIMKRDGVLSREDQLASRRARVSRIRIPNNLNPTHGEIRLFKGVELTFQAGPFKLAQNM